MSHRGFNGHLPPITKTIQVRRTRHAGHCWRSRDELIRDVLLWIPTHGRAKAGRPARTYIQQLCEDTECCPEDLPRAMNDREEWRERVRDIRATSAIWWWWWWWFDSCRGEIDSFLPQDAIIIIMSCCKHRYPWPSLATPPYRSSLLADPLGYIPYLHRAAVCKFKLVILLLFGHMTGSIGEHHLWARPCFFSNVLHVWFV